MNVVSIDGVICPSDQALVSVFDRAFLHGDGAFEVLRSYGGAPHALAAHLARLWASCARLGFEPPIDSEQLQDELRAVLDVLGTEDARVRISFSRAGSPEGGLAPAATAAGCRVITAQRLPARARPGEVPGISAVTLTDTGAVDQRLAPGTKSLDYLRNILALGHAAKVGAAEAFLMGPAGELLEGASSNVFCFDGERLRTPSTRSGILAGITRDTFLRLARSRGMSVEEGLIWPSEMYRCLEIFITSSVRELVPVIVLDGRPVGDGRPGPVQRALHQAYRAGLGLSSPRP